MSNSSSSNSQNTNIESAHLAENAEETIVRQTEDVNYANVSEEAKDNVIEIADQDSVSDKATTVQVSESSEEAGETEISENEPKNTDAETESKVATIQTQSESPSELSSDASDANLSKNEDSSSVVSESKNSDLILDEVKLLAADLENALENGQLKKCISIYEKCQSRLRKLIELKHKKKSTENLQQKINSLYVGVRALKDWRHWGMDLARQDLIKNLENLKGSEEDPRVIYNKLKDIRETWNKWNQSGDFPNRELREQFSTAYDEAFKPCKKFFKAQKKLRKSNKKARNRICAELEELYESTNWNRANWVLINDTVRNARKQWFTAVPLNKKDWLVTNSKFDEIMAKFQPHLEREKEKGIRIRLELIERVNALDSLNINEAIEKTKQYQKEWNTVVIRDRKKKENELWNNFRAACDKQFQRRKDQNKAVNESKQEARKEKKALLNRLEQLSEIPTDEVSNFASEAKEIQQKWSKIYTDRRDDASFALEKQFGRAQKKFKSNIRSAEKVAKQELLTILASKAEICEEVESSTDLAEAQEVLANCKIKWDSIQEKCGEHELAISQRFEKACKDIESNANTGQQAELEKNHESKQHLCLRLEVLAEIDSPPEFARQRMQYNVDRLNAAMIQRQEQMDAETEIEELLIEYWLTGAVPTDSYLQLKQRFEKIRNEFFKNLKKN